LSDNPALVLEQLYPADTEASTAHSLMGNSFPISITSNMKSFSSGKENAPSFSELASVLVDCKPTVLADVLAGLVTVAQFVTLQQILQVLDQYILLFHLSKVLMSGSLYEYVTLRVIIPNMKFCVFVYMWLIHDTVSS
jgi:hypothetical protein